MYNLPVGPSCRGPWSPLTRGSSGGPWHQTSTYWCIHAWAPPGNAVERHVPIGLLPVSILVRLPLRLMGVVCSRRGRSGLISYAKICEVFKPNLLCESLWGFQRYILSNLLRNATARPLRDTGEDLSRHCPGQTIFATFECRPALGWSARDAGADQR